jgi:hypothetical protein
VFRATYERGVRHFILQPVRAMNLEPQRQAAVDIAEEEILPHLNEFLRRTEGLDAIVKPYGFSRQGLFAGDHIEYEQNRLKNVYGRDRGTGIFRPLVASPQPGAADGAHWIDVQRSGHDRARFASDGTSPILDEALARGLDLPFGCRMGSCGMCCARLTQGPGRPERPDLPHPGAGAAGIRPALSGAGAGRRHPVDSAPRTSSTRFR